MYTWAKRLIAKNVITKQELGVLLELIWPPFTMEYGTNVMYVKKHSAIKVQLKHTSSPSTTERGTIVKFVPQILLHKVH
jgi:hypothetical protein